MGANCADKETRAEGARRNERSVDAQGKLSNGSVENVSFVY
jgi:hypothetical protein